MNLIDESFENTKIKQDNSGKFIKIIGITVIILLILIVAIIITLTYIEKSTLRLYINGKETEKVKQMMIKEEDGTIYFPIKEIAPYLGYQSYNGEYSNKSEDVSKCYIQCNDEIANFTLSSNKVYKLLTSENEANYEYFYAQKPVKAINGVLYATSDAIEEAFNILLKNDEANKKIEIFTMPELIQRNTNKVLDLGYEKISEDFTNQKLILKGMLVVTKNNEKVYGVIDLKGNSIIEPKYDNIKYIPSLDDFLVTSNNKVGVITLKKEMKISILYDSLKLIDSDSGLYLAKRDNKYGIIDSKGKSIIYPEYDQIGIDINKFKENEIKNRYLLDNGMIVAKKDKYWGAFDKNGEVVVDFEYDSFGYVATNNKNAINLLLIPEYNVLVACKNKKYTLLNSFGEELCYPILDDVYMTINSGKKYYYMNYNNKTGESVIEFLDQIGVKTKD